MLGDHFAVVGGDVSGQDRNDPAGLCVGGGVVASNSTAEVMKLAKKMSAQMKEKLHADGFNLVQNNGAVAGQTVMHFHLHLIPRYENDGQHISWHPGQPSQDELEAVKNQIVE